jgi:plastocyanin
MVGIIAPISKQAPQGSAQLSIIPGASNLANGQYLSSTSFQITPGTTITIINNDSVPHRLLSGQIITTTQGGSTGSAPPKVPQFTPDGRIDSGIIAPGQHYQLTISYTGSTQFYDPSFTWINGIILSSAPSTGQAAPIKISINPGSSSPKGSATAQTYNQYNTYYTPDTVQIAPGTLIIWTNNDSIAHTIYSGVSTQRPDNPFAPDGKISSNKIAPGQSFSVVVNDTGIIRFYDPQYTWMNGLIVSMPPSTSSYSIGATSHNPGLH